MDSPTNENKSTIELTQLILMGSFIFLLIIFLFCFFKNKHNKRTKSKQQLRQYQSKQLLIQHQRLLNDRDEVNIDFFNSLSDINFIDPETGLTPIQLAVIIQNYSVVKLLLQRKSIKLDVTVQSPLQIDEHIYYHGDTLLHLAITGGSYEIFQLLINTKRISPQQVNSNQLTPLVAAIRFDNYPIARRIAHSYPKPHEIQVPVPSDAVEYLSPLYFAAMFGALKCCSGFMKEFHMSPDVSTTQMKMSPFECAVKTGNRDVIAIFLPYTKRTTFLHQFLCHMLYEDEIDVKNITCIIKRHPTYLTAVIDDFTVIHIAVEKTLKHLQFIESLGADLDVTKNAKEMRPLLHHAVLRNKGPDVIPMIEYLLQRVPSVGIESIGEGGVTVIQMAIVASNLPVLKYLYNEKGANLYPSTVGFIGTRTNSLHLAMVQNDIEIVEFLLKQKHKIRGKMVPLFDLNSNDDERTKYLQVAISCGSINLIPLLIQHGFDPKIGIINSDEIMSPTIFALKTGNYEICPLQAFEALFSLGLSPIELLSKDGLNPMEEFIILDELDYMVHFLQHSDPKYCFIANNYINPNTGFTLLHVAIKYNATRCLDYLLKSKLIPIDFTSPTGYTPFQFAIMNDKITIAKLLLQHKADPLLIAPHNGYNVLHCASSSNLVKASTVQWILQHYPTLLESKDNQLDTPLSIAVQCGNISVIKALQQSKANFNTINVNGMNLYHQAALSKEKNHHDIIEYLSKHVKIANITNSVADDGSTPLVKACECGNVQMMKYLWVTKKLSYTVTTNNGWDLLHWVILSDNNDAIRWILQQRPKDDLTKTLFNPNAINHDSGYNALHFAVVHMKLNAIPTLIEFKADPLIKTMKGQTIIDLAQQQQQESKSSTTSSISNEELITLCKQLYENERKLHLTAADMDNEID